MLANDSRIVPTPEQLALLNRVIHDATRSRRMSAEDAEDFAQCVQLRLVERAYDVFDRFMGKSSLRTYLTVVVRRMLLDWQNSEYGKWRPSAAATRLGERAVDLDRLISRDGCSIDEAIARLNTVSGDECAALRGMAEQLPQRQRRQFVSTDELVDLPDAPFADPIEASERRARAAHVSAALADALERLPAAERRLIALRFEERHKVPALAKQLRTDPRVLYRRIARILQKLRRSLEQREVVSVN